MKILVTGAHGQLGSDICKRLNALHISNEGVDIEDFDLTNQEQTISAIQAYQPDHVIHCAAYTAVDQAEKNRDACFAINVEGTRNVALGCKSCDASMVYISTDYVFSGEGDQPFATDDLPNPLSVYGESKWLGEQMVQEVLDRFFIVRTSWIYGVNGRNFVKAMLRLSEERPEISVVCDQIGSPTYTTDLSVAICDLLQTGRYGVYHCTNEGFCSWYEFACEIMRLAVRNTKIKPIPTTEYASQTRRPLNSRLSKRSLDAAGIARLPSWQSGLERYLHELEEYSPKER